jgi:hypothetical protein
MATAAPQAAMQMPQQGASPFADPNAMAVYDQLRQTTSPKAFGDEMLAGAAQADPQAVAKFLQKLQSLNVPPEVLDALNNVVDEILANPERYDELRAKYIAQGLPEKILPARFDPQFFVALNMAIDQMIAEPAGVQSFAQGGIAELKPIAKAIASYGRNGDTMLAHITPAEARMLRRRGGSGTINPDTGLPEFFLDEIGDFFSGIGDAVSDVLGGIGDAVQDFVESEVGQMITTVAIGYFLGPAVAAQFGVTSSVGVAAISGFVGSAGSTLLGGGDIGDALKAGAIGGLTAGAGAGVFGGSGAFASGSYTGPTTVGGQVDKFTGMFSSAPTTTLAPVPDASSTVTQAIGPDVAPTPNNVISGNYSAAQNNLVTPTSDVPRITAEVLPTQVNAAAPAAPGSPPPYRTPTISESFSKIGEGLGFGDKPASFDTFKQGAGDLFAPAAPSAEQINARAAELVNKTPTLPFKTAVEQATAELSPGMLRTYGPAAVAGLGALGAFGGFEAKPVQSGPITKELVKPATQRIAEKGTQRQVYSQGLPGVVYDQFGAPVYGQSVRLPTYDVPDYNSGGYGMPQGGINLPPIYVSPPGTIGSRSVAQPYNTSDMYPNLVPVRAAEGGSINTARYADGGPVITYRYVDGEPVTQYVDGVLNTSYNIDTSTADNLVQATNKTEQKAARDAVAQQKALRRSQGSGQMYNNINAGLAALAPESFPGQPITLSPERLSAIKAAYSGIAARPANQVSDAERYQVAQQGRFSPAEIAAAYPEIGFGEVNRIMGRGALQQNYAPMFQGQRDAMNQQAAILSGRNIVPFNEQPFPMPRYTNAGRQGEAMGNALTPTIATRLMQTSMTPVGVPTSEFDRYGGYEKVKALYDAGGGGYGGPSSNFMNMGGIATLGAGGYPRRTGQISGPGTEKSDSIPAMLSDGEFVMTAKAVRGAGKGSRRAGAKKMYALMHQLEKNSERG